MYRIILLTLLPFMLQAALLITPEEAMQSIFNADSVDKKTLMVSKAEAPKIEEMASRRLDTRLYKLYVAKKAGKVEGYGIVIARKVRTKNAAVLYTLTPSGVIKAVEIIAFNEPPEFIPPHNWLAQFEKKTLDDNLQVGRNVPTITGATLSARALTDAARLAQALFEVKVKEKP